MDVGATSVTNISRRRWTPGTHGSTPRTGEFNSRSMSSADRSDPDIPSTTKAVTEPMINPRNADASTITTGDVDADFAVVASPITSPGSGWMLLSCSLEAVSYRSGS